MRTHPLWRRFEVPTMAEINAARLTPEASTAPVDVVAPDPAWPESYDVVRERIRAALRERALAIEHVGSTAVPGLWAKPVIDIDLTVADSAAEDDWLSDLEAAGFVLRVREPEWEQHRFLRGPEPLSNVHVFSPGAREPQRHLMFRDWLRTHPEDRDRYGEVKREVAARGFTDVMLYNNAKAWIVYDMYEKAFAGDPRHPHDPQPRPADRRPGESTMLPAPTRRLRFRQMTADDLADVATLEIGGTRGPKGWIDWNLRNYADHGFGLWVIETHAGEFVGDCGLTMQEAEGEWLIEVGWHVRASLRRQGYAAEAAEAVLAAARDHGVVHLIAIIRPDNHASQGVATKIGLVLEREIHKNGGPALVFGVNLGDRV